MFWNARDLRTILRKFQTNPTFYRIVLNEHSFQRMDIKMELKMIKGKGIEAVTMIL